jgi:DTW domain-containing protein YfiP
MKYEHLVSRPTCYRCFRPVLRCICELVPSVRNRTPVLILQHPRERLHPFGTATLAALALERVRVQVAWLDGSHEVETRFEDGDYLLFPDPDAPQLHELAKPPRRLVVVDGTWAHARRILRHTAELREVPRVRLAPSAPSRYRIRREPAFECLSTLESIVAALRALEPETRGFEPLLAAFECMIDRQLALSATRRDGPGGGRRRLRRRASQAIPEPLRTDPDRCVVVYGESAAPPPDGDASHRDRRPVYWAAVGMVSGDCFERFVRDGPRPSDWHLAHMGLDARLVAGGVPLAQARTEWQHFVGSRTVVAWNRSSLDLASALGSAPGLLLKGVYSNATRQPGRPLEQVVRDLALDVGVLPVRGRAQERLGNCLAVARWLHSRSRAQ